MLRFNKKKFVCIKKKLFMTAEADD